MEGLQQWALSICASVLIAGLFSALAPKGSMEKLLRMVIAVFLVMALVSPFLQKGGLSLSVFAQEGAGTESIEAKNLEQSINEQMAAQMEAVVKSQISACLKKMDVSDEKVRVTMDIAADGRIQISEIMILIPDSGRAKRQQIRQAVKDELGLNVTVSLESEV